LRNCRVRNPDRDCGAEIGKPACMNGKVSVQACPDALALARKTD
jgi:hypothetical protein